jgi:hypothetical protein
MALTAPARISTGPLTVSTARRCWGFSESSFNIGRPLYPAWKQRGKRIETHRTIGVHDDSVLNASSMIENSLKPRPDGGVAGRSS